MKLLPEWLRKRLRPGCAPKRRHAPRARLLLEALEDRIVPSASPTNWRDLTFTINDTAIGPAVAAASASSASSPSNASFGSLIGLNSVLANSPYHGQGYSVAVIDTGINYNDPNLGGGWGKRVIAGWNFVANNNNPMDDNGHGTFVASEIASSSSTESGVAPDVNLIALKVLDSTGTGTYGNVDLALQWVAAHQAQYNIVAVNLSLGSGNYTANPYTFLESDFATLKADGIFIAVAAGNDFYADGSAPGLAYPAISSNVVSVGAVWTGNFGEVAWANGAIDYTTAADQITSFSQRSAQLDLLAPGAVLTDDALGGGLMQMAGTSMATPIVAGAAVLLHEALVADGLSVDANQGYILQLMQSTGTVVVDNAAGTSNVTPTGLSFRMLNLQAALNHITPPAPAIAPISDVSINAGQSASVTVTASDAPGYSVYWVAHTSTPAQEAFNLTNFYKLAIPASYELNRMGLDEKWLYSYALGGLLVCILPDGTVRRYDPAGVSAMLTTEDLLGRVDPACYANPALLVNAPAPPTAAQQANVTISGSRLTITPNAGYTGELYVVVSALDGIATAREVYLVTVNSASTTQPPVSTISDQSVAAGKSATLTVATSSAVTGWSAQVMTAAQEAYQVEQQLQLTATGNYYTNEYGMDEKWLWSKTLGGLVVCILPDGTLRKYSSAGKTAMLSSADLLARVDPAYYSNPLLLTAYLNAAPPAATNVATLSTAGSQLTVTPDASFQGDLCVVITATEKNTQTVKETVIITVA